MVAQRSQKNMGENHDDSMHGIRAQITRTIEAFYFLIRDSKQSYAPTIF